MTTLVLTAPVLVLTPPVHVDSVHNLENIPPVFTRRDVMKHCDETSCWIIVEDKVYDVSRFLDLHPGGSEIIMECAGSEASAAFWDKGHSRHAIRMLDQYYIGQLKPDPKLG